MEVNEEGVVEDDGTAAVADASAAVAISISTNEDNEDNNASNEQPQEQSQEQPQAQELQQSPRSPRPSQHHDHSLLYQHNLIDDYSLPSQGIRFRAGRELRIYEQSGGQLILEESR